MLATWFIKVVANRIHDNIPYMALSAQQLWWIIIAE